MNSCSTVNSIKDLNFIFSHAERKWLEVCCEEHSADTEGFLVGHCIPLIVKEAGNLTNDIPHVLRCANTLNRLTAILCEFSQMLSMERQQQVLQLCLFMIDYPLADSIGFQAAAIFGNLLELHRNYCKKLDFPTSAVSGETNGCCEWPIVVGFALIPQKKQKECILSKQRAQALQSLLKYHPELRANLLTDDLIVNIYYQIQNTPITTQISHLIIDDISVSLSSSKLYSSIVQEQKEKRLNLHLQWIRHQLLHENVQFPFSPHSQRAFCSLIRIAIEHSSEYVDGEHRMDWIELLSRNIGKENTKKQMSQILHSADIETRFSAWALICSHPKSSHSVHQIEIELAKEFLASNMRITSPSARQTLFSKLDKLLSRIREHSRFLLKNMSENAEESSQIELYAKFFKWLHQLAFKSMSHPEWHRNLLHSIKQLHEMNSNGNGMNSSNYHENDELVDVEDEEIDEFINHNFFGDESGEDDEGNFPFSQRISALTLASLLYTSVNAGEEDPFSKYIGMQHWIGPSEITKLKHELDDRFEICQELALALLNRFSLSSTPNDCAQITEEETLFLAASPHMPRHQQALEYRLCYLLPRMNMERRRKFIEMLLAELGTRCSETISNNSSDQNLLALIKSPQMHALLSAFATSLPFVQFRYGMDDPTLSKMLSLCLKAAEVISPVVHSMSPEGFLPIANQNEQKESLRSSEVSSLLAHQLARTCFRSHKAISRIFAQIIEQMPNPSALSNEQLHSIWNYFWLQLTKCRHRGAFEAAAEAFSTICKRFWAFSSNNEEFPCNPSDSIGRLIETLTGRNDSQQFCVTRRSAGLPHLMCTLLATEPIQMINNHPPNRFQQTLQELLNCRTLVDPELEVHCVNVLRLLFVDSNFAERILPYVEHALSATFEGSASDLWPVRNAYTQLFAALIKRIFGVPALRQRSRHVQPRCKQSAHEFFTRNPTLYEHMYRLLEELVKTSASKPLGSRNFFQAFPLLILFTHLRPVAHPNDSYLLTPFLPNLVITFDQSKIPPMNFVDAIQILLSDIAELGLEKELTNSMDDSPIEKLRIWLKNQTKIVVEIVE